MLIRFNLGVSPMLLTVLAFSFITYSHSYRALYYSSPTGQQLNYQDIKLRFPFKSNEDIRNRLFEVTKEHTLFFAGKTVHLRSETSQPNIIQPIRGSRNSHQIFYRAGREFSYAYKRDGHIFALSVGNVHLVPVNQKKYPGVFINRFSTKSVGKSSKNQRNLDFIHKSIETDVNQMKNKSYASLSLPKTERNTEESCSNLGAVRALEIAVAFDHTFCQDYGSIEEADSAIYVMMSDIRGAFRKRTCLQLQVVHIEGECDSDADPFRKLHRFTRNKTKKILKVMTKFWRKKRKVVHRDLTMFYTGFNEEMNFDALGNFGSTCSPKAYSWVNGLSPIYTAHGIARMLSAPIDDSRPNIMNTNPEIENTLEFTDSSAKRMIEFIDSNKKEAKCIELLQDVSISQPATDATCKGWFNNLNAMTCMDGDDGTIETKYGDISVYLNQVSDSFEVLFDAPEERIEVSGSFQTIISHHFTTYRRAFSMKSSLAFSDLAPDRRAEQDATYIWTTWKTSEIQRADPESSDSCCGEPMYMHVRFVLERREKNEEDDTTKVESLSVSKALKWYVTCTECDQASYEPMSVSLECPVCL